MNMLPDTSKRKSNQTMKLGLQSKMREISFCKYHPENEAGRLVATPFFGKALY